MKKIYCVTCEKYKEFKIPKISYIHDKILLFSSICDKCGCEDVKIFEEKDSIKILKFLGLIKNTKRRKKTYFKDRNFYDFRGFWTFPREFFT